MYLNYIICSIYLSVQLSMEECYKNGLPQMCKPQLGNIAYGKNVITTNTCGMKKYPTKYCFETNQCRFCDNNDLSLKHPPVYLTDFNRDDNVTWWQSETMYENIDYPNSVNLTLDLGKTYDITYITLKFVSPVPESFVIYKRSDRNSEWEPYQYFSSSCQDTYSIPRGTHLPVNEQDRPFCVTDDAQIFASNGNAITFGTLKYRNATNFEHSDSLQQWVTASGIRISLNRMNAYGNEIFGDISVLQSYYYAISDFVVGGHCKCNGHASNCILNEHYEDVCNCTHNTAGRDCQYCLPFYVDQPWMRATSERAYVCQECRCNNHSRSCYFDQKLYEETGHGGHCVDCQDNRDGTNCERCKFAYYENSIGQCVACNCNTIGSNQLQCNSRGVCSCKDGVAGDKCEYCKDTYYGFSENGCLSCNCSVSGSFGGLATCHNMTGECKCKQNVEGQTCSHCKPSYFALSASNMFGCTSCFCYGHSSNCVSAHDFVKVTMASNFNRNQDGWRAVDISTNTQIDVSYDSNSRSVYIDSSSINSLNQLYFQAPDMYLGDQRFSYGKYIRFVLNITRNVITDNVKDVIIENNDRIISLPIYAQNNEINTAGLSEYTFRLHENEIFEWYPHVKEAFNFITLLANITSIKIRANYAGSDRVYLHKFEMDTAEKNREGMIDYSIENCQCPSVHLGDFCEFCIPGYYFEDPSLGPLSSCVKCNCNNHSDMCASKTGECICMHNTQGYHCGECQDGYYGDATLGTPTDCTPCPCPDQSSCSVDSAGDVVCEQCPIGYDGKRCDICADGWYRNSLMMECTPCDCSSNVDVNARGNCNSTTGECVKCLYNTHGWHCDTCLPGHYGDALSLPHGDCRQCDCNAQGTVEILGNATVPTVFMCSQLDGRCKCKPNVHQYHCDRCNDGYWDISSSQGCRKCGCNETGSQDALCNTFSGECNCRHGVIGKHCNECSVNTYNFSSQGCSLCDCHPEGSLQSQCDIVTGKCTCRENVIGDKCNRCRDNTHNITANCVECPICYNLVNDAVNEHRNRTKWLIGLIENFQSEKQHLYYNDTLSMRISQLSDSVTRLYNNVMLKHVSPHFSIYGIMDRKKSSENQLDALHVQMATAQNIVASNEQILNQIDMELLSAGVTLNNASFLLRQQASLIAPEGRSVGTRIVSGGVSAQHVHDIAARAQSLVATHELQTRSAHVLVQKAFVQSNRSYTEALGLMKAQRDSSVQIMDLTDRLKLLKSHFDETLHRATRLNKQSQDDYDAALNLYAELVSYSNNVDYEKYYSILSVLQQKSDTAKAKLRSIEMILIPSFERLNSLKTLIKSQIDNVGLNQLTLNRYRSQVYNYSLQIKKSIQSGEQVISNARNTLKALKSFKHETSSWRDTAMSSKLVVDVIVSNLSQIELSYNIVQKRVFHIHDVATSGAANSRQIMSFANQTKKAAFDMLDNARRHQRLNDLTSRSDIFNEKIRHLEHRLNSCRHSYCARDNSTDAALSALKTAGSARTKAARVYKQLKESAHLLSHMVSVLRDTKGVDATLVTEYELRVTSLQQQLSSLDFRSLLLRLEHFRLVQLRRIKRYKHEASELRSETDRVSRVMRALPHDCYSRITLDF